MLPIVVESTYLGSTSRVDMFLAQLAGVAIIATWTIVTTALIWGAFRAVGQARVSPDHEQEGLDVSEHGVETYPEFGDEEPVVADGGLVSGANQTSSEPRSDGGVVNDVPATRADGDSK